MSQEEVWIKEWGMTNSRLKFGLCQRQRLDPKLPLKADTTQKLLHKVTIGSRRPVQCLFFITLSFVDVLFIFCCSSSVCRPLSSVYCLFFVFSLSVCLLFFVSLLPVLRLLSSIYLQFIICSKSVCQFSSLVYIQRIHKLSLSLWHHFSSSGLLPFPSLLRKFWCHTPLKISNCLQLRVSKVRKKKSIYDSSQRVHCENCDDYFLRSHSTEKKNRWKINVVNSLDKVRLLLL